MRSRWPLLVAALIMAVTVLTHATPAIAAETTPTTEPILILKSFATTPETLTVGQQFKLDLTIDNVSDLEAGNVVVSLGAGSITATSSQPGTSTSTSTGCDVIVLGSNTKFVGTMAGGATDQQATFDLTSNPRAASGPCSVPVILTFDTSNGRKSITQSVGFVLTRPMVFDVAALEYPKSAIAGQPFEVAASISNTNDFAVRDVVISFRSVDSTLSNDRLSVGVLPAGANRSLRTKATSNNVGPVALTLVISYTDDLGAQKEIQRDFMVRIDEPAAGAVPETPDSGKPTSLRDLAIAVIRAFFGLGG